MSSLCECVHYLKSKFQFEVRRLVVYVCVKVYIEWKQDLSGRLGGNVSIWVYLSFASAVRRLRERNQLNHYTRTAFFLCYLGSIKY